MAENLANFPSLSSLGPDSHLSLGDLEPAFVSEDDRNRYTCPVHKGILRSPCQTECGHRLCLQCVPIWLAGAPSKRCPVGESDCVDLTPNSDLRPDRSIERELRTVRVYCKNKNEGCEQQVKLRDLRSHYEDCPFETVDCEYSNQGCKEKIMRKDVTAHREECPFRPARCSMCREEVIHSQKQEHEERLCPEKVIGCPFGCGNTTLKRKEVESHRDVCAVRPVDCKFKLMGCSFSNKKEVVLKHEMEDLPRHLELIRIFAGELKGQLSDIQTQSRLKLVNVMEKVFNMEQNAVDRPRFEELTESVRQLQQALNQGGQQRENQQLVQSSAGGGGSVGAATVGVIRVPKYDNVQNMADVVYSQLNAHDRQLGMHDVRMAEMDLRFQLLETASYDGTLVWKIRDYQRRKMDAVNGRTLSLYSQPFYSDRFGYKMCARVYLNGDGMGKTTHMSLFFVVMRGEYDALLNWPFRQKVTLTLLDQSQDKRHLTDHFQPDPTSSSFQRPMSEMNVASGCPLFVSHAVLESNSNGYLKDDTIFIRIVVDRYPQAAVF